jgi:hypothetical protein
MRFLKKLTSNFSKLLGILILMFPPSTQGYSNSPVLMKSSRSIFLCTLQVEGTLISQHHKQTTLQKLQREEREDSGDEEEEEEEEYLHHCLRASWLCSARHSNYVGMSSETHRSLIKTCLICKIDY